MGPVDLGGGATLTSTEVRRKALMVQRKWTEVGTPEDAEDHQEEVHREEVRGRSHLAPLTVEEQIQMWAGLYT